MPGPNDFSLNVTREMWEDAVFKAASYFTVVQGRTPSTRSRDEYRAWTEAKQAAESDPTKMVYAVTKEGRSVMLPRSLWEHYDQLATSKGEK